MIRYGMTADQLKAFNASLRRSHSIRVEVDVLDRNEHQLAQLGARIIEGTVDVDATADVTRSLSLTVLDPARKLQWVPDSPSEAAVYADNFLRVRYGVRQADGSWQDIPVFYGPVAGMERRGPLAIVHAVGKESLVLAPALHWYPATKVPKGKTAEAAIRAILGNEGESRFATMTAPAKLPRTLSLPWDSEPWKVAKAIARGANRQLFYDGQGRVRLRSYSSRAVYTFRTGPGGDILEEPDLTFDLSAVRNTVRVHGSIREKDKSTPVHVQAVAKATHPLSPAKLARGGTPRNLVDAIDVPKVRSIADARGIATRRLKDDLLADVQLQLTTLPVPHLEEYDPAHCSIRGTVYRFRITGWSLPLVATSPMTVNVVRRVRTRRVRG